MSFIRIRQRPHKTHKSRGWSRRRRLAFGPPQLHACVVPSTGEICPVVCAAVNCMDCHAPPGTPKVVAPFPPKGDATQPLPSPCGGLSFRFVDVEEIFIRRRGAELIHFNSGPLSIGERAGAGSDGFSWYHDPAVRLFELLCPDVVRRKSALQLFVFGFRDHLKPPLLSHISPPSGPGKVRQIGSGHTRMTYIVDSSFCAPLMFSYVASVICSHRRIACTIGKFSHAGNIGV